MRRFIFTSLPDFVFLSFSFVLHALYLINDKRQPFYSSAKEYWENNMTPKNKGQRFHITSMPMLLCVCLTLCSVAVTVPKNLLQHPPILLRRFLFGYHTAAAGSRDNTPVVLTGSADGTVTLWKRFCYSGCLPIRRAILWFPTRFQLKVKLRIAGSDRDKHTYKFT